MKDARLTAQAKSASKAPSSGMKTVKYDGYQAAVPDSWPVYNLDKDPRQAFVTT
jgi:hypothetical protein